MKRAGWALAAVALVGSGLVAGYFWAGHSREDDRQAQVAERGTRVMPFDLERTTHRFQKTADGGIQTVVVDEASDDEQVGLVRGHLRSEAARFRAGDFADPASIHGMQMPGLAELERSPGRLEIRYEDVPAGGRIRYSTGDASLVAALHAWFDAQVSDHGAHAETVP